MITVHRIYRVADAETTKRFEAGDVVWLNQHYPPSSRVLRLAVRHAIKAHHKSGYMVDAALMYARFGLSVFPLDVASKRPIPRRDPDPTGKYPNGIPGTGGVYKATTDQYIIRNWWRANPQALIGLPMGRLSSVWTLDIDTAEDHADGITGWNELIAQHGAIITREHRTATGGLHLIFVWDGEHPIGCSKGSLPRGIEVKGQGGYIVVPPSQRKGRSYGVGNDVNPIPAPQWLIEQIIRGDENRRQRRGRRSKKRRCEWNNDAVIANLEELADAMHFVPNNDLDWDEWTSVALALFAASGGSERGFALFDAFSQKSAKYDHRTTRNRWGEIQGSPPSRTGAGKLFKIARENGWAPGLREAPPTYPNANSSSADVARSETRRIVRDFLANVANPSTNMSPDYPSPMNVDVPAVVWAACIDVGIGKTQITIEELAAWIRLTGGRSVIYAVPRHKLGFGIAQRFAAYSINAKIFRGRNAEDPENPGERMCKNPRAVNLALKCHAEVAKTCCKYKKHECKFYTPGPHQCGYERQKPHVGEQVDIWIVAHDMAFHHQKVFGKPAAVIVDEAIWQKGIRGIEREENEIGWVVPIDSISNRTVSPADFATLKALGIDGLELEQLRFRLAHALRQQEKNGGVERKHLEAELCTQKCTQAIALEWKRMPRIAQHPGMSQAEIKKLANNLDMIDAIQHSRRIIKVWEAVREVLDAPEIKVSGRLTLKQQNGLRVVEWRGIAPISKQFQVPTLLLDATLPDLPILQVLHPQVEIVADIRVKLPGSVRVQQVLGTPTSSMKLDSEKHLLEVRRYILQRYIETGRQSTLVICQQKVEEQLKSGGLPHNISVEHYNDIAGIDDYRNARLLILIGRTQPGPQAPEALAAALTGSQPIEISSGGGFTWYPRVRRGIRLANDIGIETLGDQHPDPVVESIRWLICEGEQLQGIGRGRGINRTADTPLDIDLLFDTCLPITVDAVLVWRAPSKFMETAIDGVMLTAPVDMVKLWDRFWPNAKAAYRTLQQGVPVLPGFLPVNYQLAGANQKWREGFFDLAIVPNPMTWLQDHLGTVAVHL